MNKYNECIEQAKKYKLNYVVKPIFLRNKRPLYLDKVPFIKKAICPNQILVHNRYIYKCSYYENSNMILSEIKDFNIDKTKEFCNLNGECSHLYQKIVS